jgi:hypothetical protein
MGDDTDVTKQVWTESDFDSMNWHDSTIHAIRWSPETYEFLLDIDYVVRITGPSSVDERFSYLVAPATLAFRGAYELSLDVSLYDLSLSVDRVQRDEQRSTREGYVPQCTEWLWTINCIQGEITLRAPGFALYLRSAPQDS